MSGYVGAKEEGEFLESPRGPLALTRMAYFDSYSPFSSQVSSLPM